MDPAEIAMNIARIVRSMADDRGSTAVEFAMLAPIYIGLTLAVLTGGLLLFTIASLHFAVEGAARCSSVMTATCTDATSTQNYASNHYYGPGIPAPTFTASSPACGHQVSATVTYVLDAAANRWSVPLSATSCFP
jgi:Flp pilus assembly protein TadG